MAESKRSLGVFVATLMVVGNVLGVGIFYTAGAVQVSSGGSLGALWAWVVGGVLAFVGGLVTAECATRFPQNGGDYLYLSEGLGRPLGFLSGWASFIVGFPGSIAALAAALVMLFEGLDPLWVVAGVTLVALLPIRLGSIVNGMVTVLALGLLLTTVTMAPEAVSGESQSWTFLGFGAALLPVYFSYSGWNIVTYISGECVDPRRTIPIALFSGIAIVALVYILFSQSIPVSVSEERLGAGVDSIIEAMKQALGSSGEWGVPAIMTAGVCTTLMSTTLAGPRLVSEMAERGDFFSWFAARSPKTGVPVRATLVQGLMASLLVATGTFEDLLEWTTGVMLFFGSCLGVAQFRLRKADKRAPGVKDIFRDPLFPLTPALLTLLCAGILVSAVLSGEAWHMIVGLLVVLCGLPVRQMVGKTKH